MTWRVPSLAATLWLALAAAALAEDAPGLLDFSDVEQRQIQRHGPWPMPWSPDPSNRVSAKPDAIALGERLFFDARLSRDGTIACATCHRPSAGWTDGRYRGIGLEVGDRNTMSLFNVRHNRWFGWDGAGDSLWAQSLRPLLDPREMGGSADGVKALLASDPTFALGYRAAFGVGPGDRDAETVLVDAAKALAAFQETIVSGRVAFDDFRDALARADQTAAARYPLAAQRGLRIFLGRGNCALCHSGPNFTSGEFDNVGVRHFVRGTRVDGGRHEGISKLLGSPFNLLGRYNDDPARATAWATRHVALQHRNFGEFKVPSLRNLKQTAPYMHNGLLISLGAAVLHYSELDESRVEYHGKRILRRLDLAKDELTDLVVFLETLSP